LGESPREGGQTSGFAPSNRQPSLRRVLLLWLLTPLLVLIPLAAALIYALALRPALDGLDRALTDTAVALAQIVQVDPGGRTTLPISEQTEHALQADLVDETFFAVGDGRGGLLGGNDALLALAPSLQPGGWRFFDSTLSGKSVRVAAHAIGCGFARSQVCAILVAETLEKRRAAERAMLLAALLGATALALPMALLSMIAVSRGMHPLNLTARDVGLRSSERLEPIDTRSVPREVVPFVHALNDLFGRLREASAAQRAFIANAAHQLRTPLAVLRVEAAQALAVSDAELLRPILERLHSAVERAARLAQQLLTLARAEATTFNPMEPVQALDLSHLAAESADRWLHPSLEAGQDLGFDLVPAWVVGNSLLLEELLGNLVHNAIEHAGPGSRITIRTDTQDGRSRLCVDDDGCGIDVAELPSMWSRFSRGRRSRGTGSGLGLAIVKDIARLHDADATLTTGEGGRGLRACVSFPRTEPQASMGDDVSPP
jgi:two-component system sensor histidine kinase TctE